MDNQKALTGNAADREQVKSAASKEKRKREEELNDLREVASTVRGRRFIWRFLDRCGVYRSSFTGSSQTFFLEGERNIGLTLMNDLTDADPDMYLKIIKENRSLNNA